MILSKAVGMLVDKTSAAAKTGDSGGSLQGAVAGGPGVWVYHD